MEKEKAFDKSNNIKGFKFIISIISAICLLKSFENNGSFDTMTGISIAGIYDYYILSLNVMKDEYSNFIKGYSVFGMVIYGVALTISLAGNFGLLIEKDMQLLLKLRLFSYPSIPKKIIAIAFLIILGYNMLEMVIPTKRLELKRV